MDTQRNNADTPPDRLNEDWRFGRPHAYAGELLSLLEAHTGDAGSMNLGATGSIGDITIGASPAPQQDFPSIGSGYIVKKLLAKPMQGLSLHLSGSDTTAEAPLDICCELSGLFLPYLHITIEPGAHVHILERHVHRGASTLICLRRYTVMPGASLSLEVREEGSGSSRALNLTHIHCIGNSRVRHMITHQGHAWAREETTATLTAQDDAAPELLLLSANHLRGEEWLDQRTQQLHLSPGGKSSLLYKNVLDDRATAIFGGNIRVEPGAHETDAYLSNLNMMLSEHGTVHSLPGLEILADRVRCSHGSATAPMDAEQLFYLLARGIGEEEARRMLAEGFLNDVWEKFREQ